jgi:Tfp pilus assembly protein PilF
MLNKRIRKKVSDKTDARKIINNIVKIPAMRIQRRPTFTQLFLLLLVVATLAATTYIRNDVWQNEMVLWEDAARTNPKKGRVHHNLGRAYDTNRLPRKAFEQYLIAVSVEPDYARAHESLGISYVSMGQFNIARHELETALQLDPDLLPARMFLDYIAMQDKQSAR